jgi:DNA polymerase epsilon subunit 1
MSDVVCEFCGHCRDLDLCRDDEWSCECCDNPYDLEALEHRLVQTVQARTLDFQTQDLACAKCRQVKRNHLASRCDKCAGPYALRTQQRGVTDGLAVFASIARFHDMPWLAEVVGALSGGFEAR